MAKAIATCTCVHCGNTFEKVAYRTNRKEADSWEEWAKGVYDTCPDCYQKSLDEESEKCAEAAKAEGLPELHGSDKQVAWALRIRAYKLEEIGQVIQERRGMVSADAMERYEAAYSYIISTDRATWWIDNRDYSAVTLLRMVGKEVRQVEAEEAIAPTEDETLVPENAQYGKATVLITDDAVQAIYPKDDTFRAVMKGAKFSWNPDARCWQKKITPYTGTAIDRAADITNRLLAKGFPVACDSAEVRAKAISGEYEAECTRWVKYVVGGKYKGWLAINIPRSYEDPDSQKLYDEARRIKGSKWESGSVMVPMAQHTSVEDYADIYGFKLSTGAVNGIGEWQAANTVAPTAPLEEQHTDKLKDILASDADVLPDLKDE